MHALNGEQIVHLWEVCLRQHPLDRALTLLQAAFPQATRQQLARLSIGRRDALLFALREQTFGPRLNSLATCPSCGERFEFALDTAKLPVAANMEPPAPVYTLATEEGEMAFRLPDSRDLAAIVPCGDVERARSTLAQRCILQASRNGDAIAPEQLPASLINAIEAQMDSCDPLAVMDIPLDCAACGRHWTVLFDIASFLWTEISAQAQRLLREVHTLASHYGWREADILALSAIRRQYYLEMVT